jgi:hypothetical protein
MVLFDFYCLKKGSQFEISCCWQLRLSNIITAISFNGNMTNIITENILRENKNVFIT